MPKRPAKPATDERSDEYKRFEKTVRDLMTVPKQAIDEARKREEAERRDGSD